jgi:glycerophosphoryl diester phosphodiesterase
MTEHRRTFNLSKSIDDVIVMIRARKILLIAILMMMTNLQPVKGQEFDIQGHRGCRGLMPENTIPGFIKAMELGVTTLEMDVVISADHQVVVSHDHYFSSKFCLSEVGSPIEKNGEKSALIYNLDYEDVKLFDCGSIGNPDFPQQMKIAAHKPLLSDVLSECERHLGNTGDFKVCYNIELKSAPSGDNIRHPAPEVFVELVHKVVSEAVPAERVIIQSFDPRVLRVWKKRHPSYQCSFLTSRQKSPEEVMDLLDFKPAIYSPYFKSLRQAMVDDWHSRDVKVIPWTVNKQTDMERIIKLGVDGLISDYPDRYFSLSNKD